MMGEGHTDRILCNRVMQWHTIKMLMLLALPPPSQSTLTGSAGRQAVIIGILLTRPCTVQYVTMSVESQNEDDVTTENKPRITSVTR